MNALDDSSVKAVRELLLRLRSDDKLIILTSHNREDISLLCDEVFHMSEGRIS